ncbi:NUDIX domain-containing protein [Streptomyces sp. NPDC087440]|uniref:NUDIX domain-containing protein n=1 Tax=Streptomyces sp. NPDC087440 TaxID=3365790 RepID=UPI00380939E9
MKLEKPQSASRHTEVVDVHLILRRGADVLLARRANTGYADGLLHAPSGHVEDGEDVRAAMIREAAEEVGITLADDDLSVALVMQHRGPGGRPRTGWFFEARYDPADPPANREPDKCSGLSWHPLAALPDGMVAYCRAGLDAYCRGERFVLHWHEDDDPIAYDGTAPDRKVPLRTSGTSGSVHHIGLRVPDLAQAQDSWGWLLGELGYVPDRRWEQGRSWRLGGAYVVLEQSPALLGDRHERRDPGLDHLALRARDAAALDALVAAAPGHGWTLLLPDRHPHVGGTGHRAAHLEDRHGHEVEVVADDEP